MLLTFDPQGMNGHPDHVAISRFAMEAAEAAADATLGSPAGALSRAPCPVERTDCAVEGDRAAGHLRRVDGVHYLVDTTETRQAKAAALRAHRTQQVPIDRCFFEQPDVEAILSVEVFREASTADRSPVSRSPSRHQTSSTGST